MRGAAGGTATGGAATVGTGAATVGAAAAVTAAVAAATGGVATAVTDSGVAAPIAWAAATAAPRHTASFGLASTAMGRPSSPATSCATMRDARRAADEQHRGDLLGGDPGAGEGPPQGHDASRPSAGRIIASNSLRVRRTSVWRFGQHDRDRHVGVGRQRLLGLDALATQPGHGGDDRGVVEVEAAERRRRGCSDDVGEHGVVEVDAAEALDALGLAEDVEAVGPLAQDGGVEGAAAEVVHGDDRARLDPLLAGVVRRRRLGLGEEPGDADVGLAGALLEEVELVGAPVGRVGQGDGRRRPALELGDPLDDPAQQLAGEGLGAVRDAAEQDRGGVADAALELAGEALGLGDAAPVGGVADEDRRRRP